MSYRNSSHITVQLNGQMRLHHPTSREDLLQLQDIADALKLLRDIAEEAPLM
jgi:hypothetical protein